MIENQQKSYSKSKKIKNILKDVFTNPYNVIVFISLVFLTYLIIVPLISMITSTFQVAQGELRRIPDSKVGDFTLYYWQRLLASEFSMSTLYKPLLNSLLIGVCVSVFSIALGSGLAWFMVRTDLPFKKFFSFAVIIPYMIPSWCKSMAWLTVFRNERVGGSAGFLSGIGINTPDWLAYGPFAIICVLTVHYYAYSYLLTSSALRSINSELEEMGEIQGASKATILRKITLPLVMPAILSSVILTFSKSIGTFGVPAFLGMKINYYTISTMLYSNIKQQNTSLGFAISIILITIAAMTVYINQKIIGTRKSYETIGGKGGRSTPLRLGKWRGLFTGLITAFIGIAVIMPIAILFLETFLKKTGDYSLSNFTLHYWIGASDPAIAEGEAGVLRNARFWTNVKNTMILVVITSVIATIIGQILGYISSRGRKKVSGKLIEQLVFIPYLIPSIAFSAIYLSMFSTRHGIVPALYGSMALMVVVSVVKHIPFASRAGTSNMIQIGTELEEAASIEGASFIKRMLRVVLPLSKGGFISGLMLIFISIMKELDLIILIITPKLATLPYMAFQYSNNNNNQMSDVVAVIMFSIVLVIYLITNKISGADISSSM